MLAVESVFRVEPHGRDRSPVPCPAAPAGRVPAASRAVDLGAVREDRDVVATVALARRDEADAAVLVVVVVPVSCSPVPRSHVLARGHVSPRRKTQLERPRRRMS